MGSTQSRFRSAPIIGAGVILVTSGLALGLHTWDSPANGTDVAHRDRSGRASAPAGVNLEPIPRRQFPLTLANQPTAPAKGVINADYTMKLTDRD